MNRKNLFKDMTMTTEETLSFDDFIKKLLNSRSVRAFTRDMEFDLVKRIAENFARIVDEREEDEIRRLEEEAEKADKIKNYIEALKNDGIDVSDLVSVAGTGNSTTSTVRRNTPRPAKYKFVANGVEKTWTGQGRTPIALQEQLDAGKELSDFLIEGQEA